MHRHSGKYMDELLRFSILMLIHCAVFWARYTPKRDGCHRVGGHASIFAEQKLPHSLTLHSYTHTYEMRNKNRARNVCVGADIEMRNVRA